jgi:hypothetical protein
MKLSKSELARIEIEKAIDLFILEKDYVCSLTLAGAAEEMLGNILNKNGNENILAELLPWFKEKHDPNITYRKLAKGANETRDELKHGHENPDPAYEVEVSEPLAAQMLMRALVNYKNMEIKPTQKMNEFYGWVKEREDEIFLKW